MEFLIITGLSGAGKTCALHSLEDIGYYCVDNLPPGLLKTLYNLCETSTVTSMKRVAVVIDVRGGNNLSNFYDDLTDFKKEHKAFSLMFLDAREDVLLDLVLLSSKRVQNKPLFFHRISPFRGGVMRRRARTG